MLMRPAVLIGHRRRRRPAGHTSVMHDASDTRPLSNEPERSVLVVEDGLEAGMFVSEERVACGLFDSPAFASAMAALSDLI